MKRIGILLLSIILAVSTTVLGLDVNNETHSGSFNIQDPSTINVNNSNFTSTSSGEIRSETEIIINPDTLFNASSDVLISAEGLTAYTITFSAASNGSITGDLIQYVNIGQTSSQVTAVPDSGYIFTGWSDGDTNPSKVVANPTGNMTITANFALAYTVTYTSGANGSIMGDLSQTIIAGEDSLIVYAIPDTGYKFVNWSDGNTNPFRIIANISANHTLTANFATATGLTGFLLDQSFAHSDVNHRSSVDEIRYYPGGSALETTQWNYLYDDLANLTSAQKAHSVDPNKNLSFTYAFDDIGNRSTATENGVSKTYTANDMNEYTSVVTGGVNKTITYDLSGNPLVYKDWDLTWDAEDRLKTMTHSINGTKLEFGYDFRGFRVWKKVFDSSETLTKWIGFVYDGELVTEEIDLLDSNKKIIRSYTWGLDPESSFQENGGIGALVSIEEVQTDSSYKDYHVVSDAGGNVTNLLESKSDGSLAMADSYENGPFGSAVATSATTGNPNRFNTKYTDEESGLIYYGYRFYDPEEGRWLNRDPIGVEGGINLYASVSNNMVNAYAGNLGYSGGMSYNVGNFIRSNEVDSFGHSTESYRAFSYLAEDRMRDADYYNLIRELKEHQFQVGANLKRIGLKIEYLEQGSEECTIDLLDELNAIKHHNDSFNDKRLTAQRYAAGDVKRSNAFNGFPDFTHQALNNLKKVKGQLKQGFDAIDEELTSLDERYGDLQKTVETVQTLSNVVGTGRAVTLAYRGGVVCLTKFGVGYAGTLALTYTADAVLSAYGVDMYDRQYVNVGISIALPFLRFCFVENTKVHTPEGSKFIQDLKLGERVITGAPDVTQGSQNETYITSENSSVVTLRVVNDQLESEVQLLRRNDWFQLQGLKVGSVFDLEASESQYSGKATVLSIEKATYVESGAGKLVTGSFKHLSDDIYELHVKGEVNPIGATGGHPFWSESQHDWVNAKDLKAGELLRTNEGFASVVKVVKAKKPEYVYNIEVDFDHVYRVGEQGLLVHNECKLKQPTLIGQDKKGRWVGYKDQAGRQIGNLKSNNSLHRPSLRADTQRQIKANAPKNNKGQYIDEKGNVIKEPHFGHVYGSENRRILRAAEKLKMTQQQLNNYVNARPNHFKIEEAKVNLSHKDEKPGSDDLGRLIRDMKNFLKTSN